MNFVNIYTNICITVHERCFAWPSQNLYASKTQQIKINLKTRLNLLAIDDVKK